MKYFGCSLDFLAERNADIMRAYREQLAAADYVLMPEIFERVAESPSRRFWVSEERAAVVVAAIEAGRPVIDTMYPSKKEMYLEIHRRYKILRRENPEASLLELVSQVVNQPAPKFYFTPRSIGEFVYRTKRRRGQKNNSHL
jgi:hypothetical protein